MKHTPTPWQLKGWGIIWREGTNEVVLSTDNKANAEHIVKCVNAHDELMEFVKGLKDQDEWAGEIWEKYGEE